MRDIDLNLLLGALLAVGFDVLLFKLFVIWEKSRTAPPSSPRVDRGPIICPYCSVLVSKDAAYAGQIVSCPACHGQFVGPKPNLVFAAKDQAKTAVGVYLLYALAVVIGRCCL